MERATEEKLGSWIEIATGILKGNTDRLDRLEKLVAKLCRFHDNFIDFDGKLEGK